MQRKEELLMNGKRSIRKSRNDFQKRFCSELKQYRQIQYAEKTLHNVVRSV